MVLKFYIYFSIMWLLSKNIKQFLSVFSFVHVMKDVEIRALGGGLEGKWSGFNLYSAKRPLPYFFLFNCTSLPLMISYGDCNHPVLDRRLSFTRIIYLLCLNLKIRLAKPFSYTQKTYYGTFFKFVFLY